MWQREGKRKQEALHDFHRSHVAAISMWDSIYLCCVQSLLLREGESTSASPTIHDDTTMMGRAFQLEAAMYRPSIKLE